VSGGKQVALICSLACCLPIRPEILIALFVPVGLEFALLALQEAIKQPTPANVSFSLSVQDEGPAQ
jgi:hypothetical protein